MSGISSGVPPIKFDSAGNVLANINAQNITPNANAVNVKTDVNGNVLANINAQNINPNVVATNVKTDANGNVLANLNAQNITPNAVATNVKTDSAGNVLANINAQNINPNAVATNVKTDANGNVLANINAQNINPNVIATNVKTDANGNVLANLNAQNINPTIANPYTPQLLSHQTGLSATISTANTWINMGTSITIPRNGIVKIILIGHTSSSSAAAYWRLTLTRGTTTYTVQDERGNVSWGNTSAQTSAAFVSQYRYAYGNSVLVIELLCLANDVLQLQTENNTASTTNYVDDLVVMLQ